MTDNEIKDIMACMRGDDAPCEKCNFECFQFPECQRKAEEYIVDLFARQEAEIERLEKGSLKEAMCFNSNTIKRCSDAAVKDFAKKLKKEIEDECASIRLNNSAYYAVNLRLIDDLVEEFTEGAQMNNDVKLAVAEAIKEFAKELVDKSTGGAIAVGDIVDLCAEYQRRLKGE